MASETALLGNPAFSSAAGNSDFRIVHPLSASPASSAFFPPPSHPSSPPQPQHNQQSQQQQQQQSQTSHNGNFNQDDVTTIFVVGFPEDMLEREFQNMFTFSPGFEAASLKWHCKDQDDDSTGNSALNSASTTSTLNGGGVSKKQMIGFARFRTRLEAMEAVEVLSGKKVDNEKGAVLKAEMAKKNLHIKRGSIAPNAHSSLSAAAAAAAAHAAAHAQQQQQPQQQPQPQQTSQPSHHHHHHHHASAAAAAAAAQAAAQAAAETGSSPLSILSRKMSLHAPSPAHYDTFSPLPSDLLSPADYKTDPFNEHPLTTSTPPATNGFHDFFSFRSQSFDARGNGTEPLVSPQRAFSLYPRTSSTTAVPTSRFHAHHHQHQHQTILEDNDPFNYLSKSSPVPNNELHNRMNGSSASFFDTDMLSQRMGSISMHSTTPTTATNTTTATTNAATSIGASASVSAAGAGAGTGAQDMRAPSLSSPSYRPSATSSSTTTTTTTATVNAQSSSNNPADQNPPCNTLYVGNLPPFTSEDELRQLFSVCRGYKRMCFRTKPQGPMCFVEFDDVVFATQAMNELQGHNLSNSVKGGIRLSFSKNPLFTKPNKQPNADF
ncbi:hypothetical protein BCR43DRAFT_500691 [Syncephalastrum racemosum]|uniref:RRM domain-containing protein n=1 Tax=Syncephalastrum racemosum TaxID=13706 RepID=A0A1X2HUB3_SYNRA|nr:hypothetical protein BCR43DRAFT_500691 [Syncephalastrum racemosum]